MQCQTLVTRVFEAYSSLQVCIREGNWGAEEAALWLSLKEDIHRLGRDGQLPDIARQAIAAVSENSAALLRSVLYLEDIAGRDIDILQQEVTRILGHHKHDEHHVTHVRSRYLRSSDDLRECGSLRLQAGCLRDWFLTHLPYPYPTYTEKRNLALQDGIPLSKIDSDLTNWRRRSGWAEIRKIYAKGSKEKMKSLLLRVERGEDTRPDLLDRIEGIRRYMDKESDKVGDWVHELASFARPDKRPKLDHASPTDTNTSHAGHRSISSVSSSSSLSDISAFATMDDQPSHAHTHDSPSTRSVSASSTLSDASIVIPSQGPKRSMSFADDEQVANKAKTSHTPLRAEPTWVDSPTEYASSRPSSFSASMVSLGGACNTLSSFNSSSDSSLPSTDGDDGEQTGYEAAAGSATAVSDALTVTDTVMSSECSSIWSTELELPSLPHMHERSAGSWRIPTLSEFRPEIGRWVQRG